MYGRRTAVTGLSLLALLAANPLQAAKLSETSVKSAVDQSVLPLMQEQGIKGMAVGVTVDGERYLYSYGLAAAEGAVPVTEETLFEIGSLSKTFTATLAAYAQESGHLALTDRVTQHLPDLRGSAFDNISLLQLGTYSAGGLPLQFPDGVNDEPEMYSFYRQWRPRYAAGSHRQYSNPSIGLLGYIAARSMGKPFDTLMQKQLFPALGLAHSYLQVPAARMPDYAQGYMANGQPVRVSKGMLDAEAYGVKTTAGDVLRFIQLNMSGEALEKPYQRAIATTQQPYYKVAGMYQGLGWELYRYPTTQETLLQGNSSSMALEPHPVEPVATGEQSGSEWLINKTGSTNGFGAYAVFIPSKRVGVVLLANKNYPNALRVKAALQIIDTIKQ